MSNQENYQLTQDYKDWCKTHGRIEGDGKSLSDFFLERKNNELKRASAQEEFKAI